MAQNITAHRGSTIDGRTTRHDGYRLSQTIRKQIEEANGWIKEVGGLAQTKLRGVKRVDWMFIFRRQLTIWSGSALAADWISLPMRPRPHQRLWGSGKNDENRPQIRKIAAATRDLRICGDFFSSLVGEPFKSKITSRS